MRWIGPRPRVGAGPTESDPTNMDTKQPREAYNEQPTADRRWTRRDGCVGHPLTRDHARDPRPASPGGLARRRTPLAPCACAQEHILQFWTSQHHFVRRIGPAFSFCVCAGLPRGRGRLRLSRLTASTVVRSDCQSPLPCLGLRIPKAFARQPLAEKASHQPIFIEHERPLQTQLGDKY